MILIDLWIFYLLLVKCLLVNFSNYDRKSENMLYYSTAFTTGGYTITTKNGGYIAPTKHLSSKDIAGLKYLYNF